MVAAMSYLLGDPSEHTDSNPVPAPDEGPRWYAVRVRANAERVVSKLLGQKGLDPFLPTCRTRRAWADRIKTLDLPLFPGYVFCRILTEDRNAVLKTGGVIDLVGNGRRPLPISDEEIQAVQTLVRARVTAQPWPFLRVGQRVRMSRGPLEGLEGILVRVKNSSQLVVSISLLERSVAAEIDAAYITPL